jgi:hypothetical protein
MDRLTFSPLFVKVVSLGDRDERVELLASQNAKLLLVMAKGMNSMCVVRQETEMDRHLRIRDLLALLQKNFGTGIAASC